SAASAPGPGGELVLDADQQQVGGEGQQRREHDPDDDRGGEVQGEAVDEQPAQAALADQGGDRDQSDGGHGGDADAGHDDRKGEGELGPEEGGGPGVAHRLGGLAHVGVDAPQPLDHVPDQDQQGVHGQPDQRGPDRQPGEGDQQDEQGQRGDREEDPGEAQDRPVQPRPADGDQPQRESQQQPA